MSELAVNEDTAAEAGGGLWRVARIVGIIGGLIVLLWAMRDRFISMVVPREPEPPTFRVAPPVETPAIQGDPPAIDLTTVPGIGPVYSRRLQQAGITTMEALAASDPGTVASAAGVPVARATEWVELAAGRG